MNYLSLQRAKQPQSLRKLKNLKFQNSLKARIETLPPLESLYLRGDNQVLLQKFIAAICGTKIKEKEAQQDLPKNFLKDDNLNHQGRMSLA